MFSAPCQGQNVPKMEPSGRKFVQNLPDGLVFELWTRDSGTVRQRISIKAV